MRDKIMIASSLCLIASCYQMQRLKRKRSHSGWKVTRGKKPRLDNEARWSDEEIEQPSQSVDSQREEESSYVYSCSEHSSSESENSNDDNDSVISNRESESDELHNKIMDTLNQVTGLIKNENDKRNDECHLFAQLLETRLRSLPQPDRSYLIYKINKLFYKTKMELLGAHLGDTGSVQELELRDERSDSPISFHSELSRDSN